MKLFDVNVLVAAYRAEHSHYEIARSHLEGELRQGGVAVTPIVLAGFVRVVTNSRVHDDVTPLPLALEQMDDLVRQPGVTTVLPGPRHWAIFTDLCRAADARGSLVTDAAIAAIAVEHGASVITFDRDFARFRGLRWEVPGP